MALDFSITPPIATLIAAAVAGSVAVIGWRVQKKPDRLGNWESIKLDLEIAAMLAADDPRATWLREYALVRLEAYAIAEVSGRLPWRKLIRPILGTILVGAVTVFSLIMLARRTDDTWSAIIYGLLGFAFGSYLLWLFVYTVDLIVRASTYPLPSRVDPDLFKTRINQLHTGMSGISTRRKEGRL